jgi:hypothetical protein
MCPSPKDGAERASHVGTAALAAIGVALIAAAAIGTYEGSLARAHAVREVLPSRAASALAYLPGASSQLGTVNEPRMAARRAALRGAFDGDDAPVNAFESLRTVPGHEDEARSLLAQFWDRKAVLTENPRYRVLYALEARVVDDDVARRLTADAAIAALGPLRKEDAFSLALSPAPQKCWTPPAVERAWGTIRLTPSGTGAVFTFPPAAKNASANTEFFGFGSTGESLAAASNAWFGERKDERLLEHEATNSAGEKSYDLAGEPFDPALALGDAEPVSSVQIDRAFFVESPAPSLIVEVGYESRSLASPGGPLRAVARWDLHGRHFCGAPIAGSIVGMSPNGDAVVIDGHVYLIDACSSERGFEPTDVTDALAVGPGAAHWVSREGDTLWLRGSGSEPPVVPLAGRALEKGAQIVFGPSGEQFLVKTATSLCTWRVRSDGALDLDGCRWSTGGWASDAEWSAADKSDEVVVFDRTVDGAALRQFFGSGEQEGPTGIESEVACNALPSPSDPPLAVLQRWEERLGRRFKDQTTPTRDMREIVSSEIVPIDDLGR